MPANRRSGNTKTSGPAAHGGQSTLSFGSRTKVTKAVQPAPDTKHKDALFQNAVKASDITDVESPDTKKAADMAVL